MTRFFALFLCAFFIGCGGSGSPSGPTPTPNPTPNPNPDPTPTTPTVKDRSYTLESLSIDSGVEPFLLRPPQATGSLQMRANGRYTLTFSVTVESFVWSQTVTGNHSFSGNTLRLVPDDSLRTTVQPFVQTVIVEPATISWTSETRVPMSLPIRPGAWRSEDRIDLVFVQGQVVASGKPVVLPAHIQTFLHAMK